MKKNDYKRLIELFNEYAPENTNKVEEIFEQYSNAKLSLKHLLDEIKNLAKKTNNPYFITCVQFELLSIYEKEAARIFSVKV